MKTKRTLIVATTTILLAGCELAGPLLIGEASSSDDEARASSAALTVEIESASGIVAGRTVAPEMFVATGDRFADDLTFRLMTPEGDLEVMVMGQAESSGTNPYTGESGSGFGESGGGRLPFPEPEGGSGLAAPFAEVLVCEAGLCRVATDFGLEIVATEAGRRATVDSIWNADETLQLTLHYTEN